MVKVYKAVLSHIYLAGLVLKTEKWYILAVLVYIVLNFIAPFVLIVQPKYILDGLSGSVPPGRILRSAEAGKDIRLYGLDEYLLNKFLECNDNYIDAKNKYRSRMIFSDIVSAACSGGVTFAVFFRVWIP